MGNRADTFIRADSTSLGTPSDSGSAWVESPSTGWQISSNTATTVSSGVETAYLESSLTDVDVQFTVNGSVANQGVLVRYVDSNNYWFCYVLTNYLHLCKFVAGVLTDPVSGGGLDVITINANDVIKVRASGSNWTVYVNGVSKISGVSDSFNSTATKHGLYNDSSNAPGITAFSINAVPSISVDRAKLLISQTSQTVVVTGVSTTWTPGTPGSPTFSLTSPPAGTSITSQVVNTATKCTLTITTGSTTGTATVTDGTLTTTFQVVNVATTIATGNWNTAANWDVGVSPGNGFNCVIVNDPFTVSANQTIGTSPASAGTTAVTINAGGNLVIPNGVKLTCRGPIDMANGKLTGQAGGTLELDASQATTPLSQKYACSVGLVNGQTSTLVTTTGTSANHFTFQSNVSGGNGYFAGAFNDAANFNLAYTDFIRWGDATNAALTTQQSTDSSNTQTFDHCTWDVNCGRVLWGSSAPAHCGWSFTWCTFNQTLASEPLRTLSSATPSAGISRLIQYCAFLNEGYNAPDPNTFVKGIPALAVKGATITDSYFANAFQTTDSSVTWTLFARNLVRFLGSTSTPFQCSAVTVYGDCTDCYWFADNNRSNPHFLSPTGTTTVDGLIWEYSGFTYGAVANAAAPTTSISASGGSLATGNYLASVTWLTGPVSQPTGETLPATDTGALAVTGPNGSITFTPPTAPANILGYNLYVSTVNGATGTETKQNGASGIPVGSTFTLTSIVAGSAKPASNTTGTPAASPDGGDCLYAGAAYTLVQKNNILVRGAADGELTGSTCNVGFTGTNFKGTHNTFWPGGQGGFMSGDLSRAANVFTQLAGNLAWVDNNYSNPGGYQHPGMCLDQLLSTNGQIDAATTDVLGVGAAHHNCGWNLVASYLGPSASTLASGYHQHCSVTQGISDVTMTKGPGPKLKDPRRGIAAWAVARGSASTTLANQIIDGLTRLAADPSRIFSDLIPWVRDGHAPQSCSVRCAAHDGTTIGAVAYQPFTSRRQQYRRGLSRTT